MTMLATRMRIRYLAAMGLTAACAKEHAATPSSPDAGPTATVTVTATVTATATATVTGSASTPPAPFRRRLPLCPTGSFCVAQPAHVAAGKAAPAPYGKCAESAPMPGDAGTPFRPANVSFDATGTKTARAKDPKACCYTWVIPCPGGRALRGDDGDGVVASPVLRDDWIDAAAREAAACARGARAGLAERWTREAGYEHASIASFARVTLDLLALGAPAELVAGAQRAALDEVEHARAAYALASALSGRAVGPGPLPPTPAAAPTLRSVVREAIAEGCIGEALAALSLREEADASTGAMRALLSRMADDEERHAELAYATVAWAASVDAESTAAVIDEELARPADGARARVVREIAEPCLRALISSGETDRRA
jgi:hypothetical protein